MNKFLSRMKSHKKLMAVIQAKVILKMQQQIKINFQIAAEFQVCSQSLE
jgi:hypothetical protein